MDVYHVMYIYMHVSINTYTYMMTHICIQRRKQRNCEQGRVEEAGLKETGVRIGGVECKWPTEKKMRRACIW